MSMKWKPGKGGEVPSYGIDFSKDKGRTKQAPSEGCDINQIVARYQKTGFLEHVRKTPGVFSDVSQLGDYHAMVTKVTSAREMFSQLPSALRSRFANDPGELVAFMADPENRDEAIELGLISKPVPKPKAEVVPKPKAEVVPPKEDVKEAPPPK